MSGVRAIRRIARTRMGAISLIVLLVLVLVAIVAPFVLGARAARLDPAIARQGSSAAHWFGTDDLGRDVFARTLVATRLSLVLALSCAALATVLGCIVGAVAAIAHGRVRNMLTNLVNWAVAFPPLIVALFITAVLGPGGIEAVFAIAIASVPTFARVTQALAVQIMTSDYIAAARTIGVRQRRIVTRYVLPNIAEPLIIQATVTVGLALVALSAMSFIGLGVQPPGFDWGRMLSEGLDKLYTTPVVALAPAGAIMIAGVTFAMLGEAIAEGFQPPGAKLSAARRSSTRRTPPRVARSEGDDVLRVEHLTVRFRSRAGQVVVPVDDVSLTLRRGDRVGIVGESGSGKTLTALALARLLPDGADLDASRLEFEGRDLLGSEPRELQRLLGTEVAVVFQDPMSSLNPALRVGTQLTEGVRRYQGISGKQARDLAVKRLSEVHVASAQRRLQQYPHEFSGGMRQRAMIAMGLMGEPSLIVADEPTTALDVTVQAQIVDLLREVNRRHGTAVVLISHDVGVVADFCSRIVVMYAGRIVEDAATEEILRAPRHPYTRALIAAIPDFATDVERPLATIPGRPPALDDLPLGCPFAPRCPLAVEQCAQMPPLEPVGPGHRAACWRAGEAPPAQPASDEARSAA